MRFSISNLNRFILTSGSALLFLGWVYFLIASASIPDPVAIHWGITGQADGFISRDSYMFVVVPAIIGPIALQILFHVLLRNSPLIRKFIDVILSIVYWMLFVIILSATSIQVGSPDATQGSFPVFLLAFLLILIPFSLWFSLAFPEIELGEELVIRLRGFKVLRVSMKEIQAVETTPMSPWNSGGLGIRVSGRTLAFIPSKGEGVVFTLNSGERIAVRSNQASEVATSALSKLGG